MLLIDIGFIKTVKKIVFALLILLIMLICVSYLNVEVLTYKYGAQSEHLYNASGWIENCFSYKVFKYADDEACGSICICRLRKTNGA